MLLGSDGPTSSPKVVGLGIICVCFLIRVVSRYHFTFTTEYIHNVLKTFLPLVTRPCRFDQITRGKIKPRTEGFINHVQMAATLIFTQPRPQGLLAFLSPPYWKARRPWGHPGDEVEGNKSVLNSWGVGT